jgi:hypothetical protein
MNTVDFIGLMMDIFRIYPASFFFGPFVRFFVISLPIKKQVNIAGSTMLRPGIKDSVGLSF